MQRRAQWQARLLVLLVYCIAVNRCSRLQLRERASQAPKVRARVSLQFILLVGALEARLINYSLL